MVFGEICVPSSRAFWDDFDEDQEHLPSEKLNWQWNSVSEPAKSDLFVIIEGTKLEDFLKTVLLKNLLPICTIDSKNVAIFAVDSTFVCVAEEDLQVSGEILNLLIPFLDMAQRVVSISVHSKNKFKTTNPREIENEYAFLRGIASEFDYAPALQSPNFICGIAAGASSWRSLHGKQVSSYVAYIDKSQLDSMSSKPLITLLCDLGFQCQKEYQPKWSNTHYLYM